LDEEHNMASDIFWLLFFAVGKEYNWLERTRVKNHQDDGAKHALALKNQTVGLTKPTKKGLGITQDLFEKWCGWRDSNSHDLSHSPLKAACLPIPPHPQNYPLAFNS
jgi:hypothetical protein